MGAGEAREGRRGKLSQAISTKTIGIKPWLANRANQDGAEAGSKKLFAN